MAGKRRNARIARREARKDKRLERKMKFRQQRYDAKADRIQRRQDGKTDRTSEKEDTKRQAIEEGINPYEGGGIVGNVLGAASSAVGSVFGGMKNAASNVVGNVLGAGGGDSVAPLNTPDLPPVGKGTTNPPQSFFDKYKFYIFGGVGLVVMLFVFMRKK